MAIVRWEPRNRVFGFGGEMDRLLNNFFTPETAKAADREYHWMPRVDIDENDNQIVIHADLPGIDKKEVKVSVEDDVLTISGERKEEKKEEGRDYHRLERRFGAFHRSFSLPGNVNADNIVADYKAGVLTVRLTKTEESKPREIEVKIS